jgi:hypothetical protein
MAGNPSMEAQDEWADGGMEITQSEPHPNGFEQMREILRGPRETMKKDRHSPAGAQRRLTEQLNEFLFLLELHASKAGPR